MGYVTSYCNKAHSERSGKPIEHECHVLPPEAIRLEKAGDVEAGIEVIQRAKPLRVHRGIAATPAWVPKRLTEADWSELESMMGGICLSCGELDFDSRCEPDARDYRCSECHRMKVCGAEDARMLGFIVVDERKEEE